jgi:chromosome segregation ATPase
MQPDVAWTNEDYVRYNELLKRAQQLSTSMEEAMQQLRDAHKSIGLVRSALTYAEDSLKKDMEAAMDSLDKKIKVFEERLFGKEDQKGINDDSHTLQSKLYTAFGHINEYANGTNAANALNNAERDVNGWVKEVSDFISGPYTEFRKRVEQQSFNYFKKP